MFRLRLHERCFGMNQGSWLVHKMHLKGFKRMFSRLYTLYAYIIFRRCKFILCFIIRLHLLLGCKFILGCNLQRKAWVNLNRIRSGCAKTKSFLHKIKAEESDSCVSGLPQTLDHILTSCPVLRPPNGADGLKTLDADTIDWLTNFDP